MTYPPQTPQPDWPPPYPPEPRRTRPGRVAVLAVVTVVLSVLASVVVAGVLVGRAIRPETYEDVEAAAAGCQPDHRRLSGRSDRSHIPVGQRVEYPVSPPAFGPHWENYLQGAEIRSFYTVRDRPPVERLLHSLEHGYTILWYDETVDPVQARALVDSAGPKVIAAPWTASDGPAFGNGTHLVLTHWGVSGLGGDRTDTPVGIWRRCQRPSREAVLDFVRRYPWTDAIEPTAP